ncbi:amino acid ABC transporter ATP-binding protein [Staphylococcus microti]|uniref:Amino acid ABC transporter ATP-binding protein n=1 Tax=Staphylococcus microti TaxID=569857 RepID=A0A0D6XT63_9STAP|nr:amino acid ABC transporter ATP-binding protein [Staphylococcus microti]KIX91802.1 amino acid ABC transporter ATP-binding protein [Staphylococcus microti]PNZ84430.1 amino acid ABC transporter ATP-binding protein [Staphylococcus microti]SUM58373.1 polar amino acid ABC transporter ATPase [Staphylococcus microti]
MLKVKNLHHHYHDKPVLKDVSFTQAQGTVTAIIGPSGSGKTTLLRTLNALVQPQQGTISIDDASVDFSHSTKQDIQRLRSQSAMVFQNYNLFNNKTALENITEGLIYGQKYSKKEAEKVAYELLDEVHLRQHADHYPIQLSGGQSQRIGIIRALALNPKLLLLDEPTSALDPESVSGILALIQKIAQRGMTMTIVTHEIQFAEAVADQIIFIDNGEIIAQGSPQQVLHDREHPRLKQFLDRVSTKQVVL